MHVQLEKALGSAAGHAYCVSKTVSNVYGIELIQVN